MFDNPHVRKWLPPILAGIGIAVIALAWVVRAGNSDPTFDSAVEQLIPGPDDQVLVQNPIGIDLVDGEPYEITLTINGTEIPDREYVVSEVLNRATYQPGESQTIDRLETGENCVVAQYWLVREGPESARATRWCFNAI
jgi:hypothetical protein